MIPWIRLFCVVIEFVNYNTKRTSSGRKRHGMDQDDGRTHGRRSGGWKARKGKKEVREVGGKKGMDRWMKGRKMRGEGRERMKSRRNGGKEGNEGEEEEEEEAEVFGLPR